MKNIEATCKGSYALGSACGTCSRCRDELRNRKKDPSDWEVGQDLIHYSDTMASCFQFKHTHPKIFEVIQKLRREIGDELDKLGSHGFSIYNNPK